MKTGDGEASDSKDGGGTNARYTRNFELGRSWHRVYSGRREPEGEQEKSVFVLRPSAGALQRARREALRGARLQRSDVGADIDPDDVGPSGERLPGERGSGAVGA